MESELDRFSKQNTQLELSIKELTQKLKATDKEMHQEREKVHTVVRENWKKSSYSKSMSSNWMIRHIVLDTILPINFTCR